MQVFLYEYATAGGLAPDSDDLVLRRELLAEGVAMRDAVLCDLLAADYTVTTLADPQLAPPVEQGRVHVADRWDERLRGFDQYVAEANAVLLIAPETNGILERLAERVERHGGRLISPSSEFIHIAGDKHCTAERLRAAGVAAPEGWAIDAGMSKTLPDFGPWVRKPRDGAGSAGLRRWSGTRAEPLDLPTRVERYCPGRAASVALLCGAGEPVVLVPCWQDLANDGTFAYRGGSLPLDESPDGPLARRARSLAIAALQALPDTQGYVGVDVVLGDAPDGSADYVMEINPRLTTSYVGLRAAARENLAQCMLQVALGTAARVTFSSTTLRFGLAEPVRRPPNLKQ